MIPAVYAPKLVISVLAIAVLGNSIVSYLIFRFQRMNEFLMKRKA